MSTAPELRFAVASAEPLRSAASPGVSLRLRIDAAPPRPVRAAMLSCQVHLDAAQRSYGEAEAERLHELFGERARWAQTLRGLLWAQATLLVPPFEDAVEVELALPCPLDPDAAAAKYLYALEGGGAPLLLLFRGTVLHEEHGVLRAGQLSWATEARYSLPLDVHRAAMDLHRAGAEVLWVRRDLFERLRRYKAAHALPTWDTAVERLLDQAAAADGAPASAPRRGAP